MRSRHIRCRGRKLPEPEAAARALAAASGSGGLLGPGPEEVVYALERCPPPEQLRQLLSEQLGEADQAAVAPHVDACLACQEYLEHVTAATSSRPRPPSTVSLNPDAEFFEKLKLV